MKIGGFQKLTLLDFPGYVACTVFTAGCNFRCPFCHNASLVTGVPYEDYKPENIYEFLETRKKKIDGVCITGGEPLLNKELPEFIKTIKDMGYLVKLDTNGSFPDRLKKLTDKGLIDYVAMDIKNSEKKYPLTTGIPWLDFDSIEESVKVLRESGTAHEFRTTVVKELHNTEDFISIGEKFGGDEKYFLQQFVDSGDTIEKGFSSCENGDMKRFLAVLKKYFPNAAIRGE